MLILKVLGCGLESEKRIDLLLKLTKIGSENVKGAIVDHLVKGYEEKEAALLNDVAQQNFNRAMKRLNDVASTVEAIKDLDWKHLKNK